MKKVKITNEKKIHMIYEVESKTGSMDEYQFICSDPARPEFHEAFKKLAPHVIDMCELPDNYLDRITVKSVSFSYGGDKEVMGATISGSMELHYSNSGLNLNTPHKACDSYNDGPADENQLLSSDCVKALNELCKECELYINGDRAQGILFEVA
jgi:hypothetical protein